MARTITQVKTITITHEFTKDQRDEHIRIRRERVGLDKAEKALKSEVRKNEKAILAAKLAGYATTPEVELRQSDALVRFKVQEIVEKVSADDGKDKPKKQPNITRHVHMEGTTLNTLLNGKLLSDKEKRKLVEVTHYNLPGVLDKDASEK